MTGQSLVAMLIFTLHCNTLAVTLFAQYCLYHCFQIAIILCIVKLGFVYYCQYTQLSATKKWTAIVAYQTFPEVDDEVRYNPPCKILDLTVLPFRWGQVCIREVTNYFFGCVPD